MNTIGNREKSGAERCDLLREAGLRQKAETRSVKRREMKFEKIKQGSGI